MKKHDFIYVEKYRQRTKKWTECGQWFNFNFLLYVFCILDVQLHVPRSTVLPVL